MSAVCITRKAAKDVLKHYEAMDHKLPRDGQQIVFSFPAIRLQIFGMDHSPTLSNSAGNFIYDNGKKEATQ